MEKLCGLYARISDPKDAGIKDNSVDTQIDNLKNYVEFESKTRPDMTWKVAGVYRDEVGRGQSSAGGSITGLTTWNAGEEFPSLGIGHFIWYPAGFDGRSPAASRSSVQPLLQCFYPGSCSRGSRADSRHPDQSY
jgi:hypothetical protein